ncbi:hypothetical protein HDV00_002832 [Rhizophlyctis rosea]|nr:hypothetical protein HDV00_002832 [Rhizophlyctis rosea]
MRFSLLLTAVLVAVFFTATGHAQISGWDDYSKCNGKIDVRKEVHDMTTADWDRWYNVIHAAATDYSTNILDSNVTKSAAYKNDTILLAKLLGKPGNFSVWDQMGWLHNHVTDYIHGNRIFLIWHRHFLRWSEKILQQRYDKDFAWFYWATHLMADANVYKTDPVWEHFGNATAWVDITGTQFPLSGIKLRGNIGWVKKLRGLFRETTLTKASESWSSLDDYNGAYNNSIAKNTKGFAVYAADTEWYHSVLGTPQQLRLSIPHCSKGMEHQIPRCYDSIDADPGQLSYQCGSQR